MKRLILAIVIIMVAVPAVALDPTVRGNRIGLLRSTYESEEQVAYALSLIRTYLRRELQKRDYEVFNFDGNYEDLVNGERPAADYYVEVIGDGEAYPYAGVGVGRHRFGVDMSVDRVRLEATVNVYDGASLQRIESFDVHEQRTTIAPAAIGVGGRHVGVWVGVPFGSWVRTRSAARAVAIEAAESIVEIINR